MTGRAPDGVRIRAATPADFDGVTAIYNHYIRTSHVTFDTRPFSPVERAPWFRQFGADGAHRLFVAELRAADEVVMTSTTAGVRPIVAVDDRPVGDGRRGPVTGVLQSEYASFVHEAVRLGIGRSTLCRKVREYGLEQDPKKEAS